MATNLALDDALITEAQRVGHHRTKREAVTQALKEYIRHRKQTEILSLIGRIEFTEGYDYKALRVRR
jgi:Arc/MetJ family transcription regulator